MLSFYFITHNIALSCQLFSCIMCPQVLYNRFGMILGQMSLAAELCFNNYSVFWLIA